MSRVSDSTCTDYVTPSKELNDTLVENSSALNSSSNTAKTEIFSPSKTGSSVASPAKMFGSPESKIDLAVIKGSSLIGLGEYEKGKE